MTIDVATYLRRCVGLSVSEAWRGEHWAVFLELGILHPHPDKRKWASSGVGDVTLMFDCRWRLETEARILAGSLDDHKTIDLKMHNLIGERVQDLSFVGRIPELVVKFETN